MAAIAQTPLGNYSGHIVTARDVSVFAGPARVRFSSYASGILRADFLPFSGSRSESSYTVIRDTAALLPLTAVDGESSLVITGSGMTVLCRKYPLRFSWFDGGGRLLLAEAPEGGFATLGPERHLLFQLPPDEHFYGTGERGTGLDLRGQSFESYNTQVYGYSGPLATMKVNVPLFLSSRGYALFIDSPWRGIFDFGATEPVRFGYAATGGELTCYVIAGDRWEDQLERYTWLTGRQPLPPRWMMGYLQSRFGYHDEAEARATVTMLRAHEIPCDAVILDLYWFAHMGDLQWNAASWPTPHAMVSDFLAQGIKTILITEPYVSQPSQNFAAAMNGGFFARTAGGQPYILQNWWSCGCPAGLVDLTDAATRSWWWSLHPPFLGGSVAGLWTDLGEPERHPDDMMHAAGRTRAVHNIYNLLWAKTVHDGMQDLRPDRRLFNLTRSGFAGLQRFGAVTWSGDVAKSFSALAVQRTLMLGMGLSGLAYHHSDIGGFCCGTTTPELYVRWIQLGAFSPVMRAHGTGQPTEPWAFGPQAEQIAREMIGLRYRLLPYLYSAARAVSERGMPILRPLAMEDPEDPALRNRVDAYMVGDDILVSPVVEEGRRVQSVRLPRGEWVDYWTGEVVPGSQTVEVSAPLERIPMFVRAGAIIPMAPPMQWSDERPLDTLLLDVYPSPFRPARCSVYEDDGSSLGYTRGEWRSTPAELTVIDGDSTRSLQLTIGEGTGSFPGMLSHRVWLAGIHGVEGAPGAVRRDGVPLPLRTSMEELREEGNGYLYDAAGRVLYLHLPLSQDSACSVIAEDVILGVSGGAVLPPGSGARLQNYPNPFNASTTITFTVPGGPEGGETASLDVYDVLGRKVVTLVEGMRDPGVYSVTFPPEGAADEVGRTFFPSGVYVCRLVVGGRVLVRKMLLLR